MAADYPEARKGVALVLGGGGSRGIAHIGVLEVLTRENICIDLIVGTSMGAIVGALFAAGYSPQRIMERMAETQGMNLLGINLFSAKARQRSIAEQLHGPLGGKTFADLQIRFAAAAVDMVTGREVLLETGDLLPALLASSAIPAVFPPVQIGQMQLADGGVIDSVATHGAFHYGAARVIAVDVYPALDQNNPWVDPITAFTGFELPFGALIGNRPPSALSSAWRAYRVVMWHVHVRRLQEHPPHVLMRPAVGDTSAIDFTDVQTIYEAGVTEAERHLAAIKALVAEG